MASRPSGQPGDALVVLDKVAIRWGGRLRFRNTSWTWRQGEQWAILGPNGSGKSLLGLALLGQAPVVRGEIRCHLGNCSDRAEPGHPSDEFVALVSPHSQRQMARQEGSFYQSRWHGGLTEGQRTVSDFLSRKSVEGRNPFEVRTTTARNHGFQEQRRRLLRRLGMTRLLHRKLIQLSNGEQRKALLIHALLKKPRLCILDEPYAGLDRTTRARLRTVINGLMKEGMPVLVVTSRPDEIPALTTHLVLVRNNRVVAQGPKRVVLKTLAAKRMFRGDLGDSKSAPGDREPFVVRALARRWGQGQVRRPYDSLKAGLQTARVPERLDELGMTSRGHETSKRGHPQFGRGKPLVELRDVTIRYGQKPILSRFSWTLRQGENWGLLGPNGSGKSTLLSLIQGDNPQAYAHDIRLFGQRPHSTRALWEVRQRIGWVSPELHLHHPPEWSCLDVVCSGFFNTIGLYQACSQRQRRGARRCLRELGLGQAEQRAFGELSVGEQRVVLLGRALVKRPQILILDEPCQGLDAAHRRIILEVVDRAAPRTGASLIFVTHHPREMPRCVTHVLELKNGRIARQGPRRRRNRPEAQS